MKYQDIIGQMTLEEKAAFLSGAGEWNTRAIDRVGIPSIFCSDGPHSYAYSSEPDQTLTGAWSGEQ